MHRFSNVLELAQQEVSSVSGAKRDGNDLLACTGDACGVGNLRALRCINIPATAYLHCTKPSRNRWGWAKSVLVTRLTLDRWAPAL